VMEIELAGLDGRHLLGYLASLGTHLALAHKRPAVTMRWDENTYHPTIALPVQGAPQSDLKDYVTRLLECALKELASDQCRFPWDNIKVGPKGSRPRSRSEFRKEALIPAGLTARQNLVLRAWADFTVGLGSDAAGSGNDLDYTALCVITGDSHQDFLRFMRDLSNDVKSEHLKSTLFERWKYQERGKSFRWDPQEDRRYALRASDPSKGPDKEIPSMWGANRLAFEALACFPCFPRGRRVRTTAFDDKRTIHWPLWSPPLNMETVKSLLAHPAVLGNDRRILKAFGVFAVASARCISVDRKRSFGPASVQLVEGN
jgi:hypothetical protein